MEKVKDIALTVYARLLGLTLAVKLYRKQIIYVLLTTGRAAVGIMLMIKAYNVPLTAFDDTWSTILVFLWAGFGPLCVIWTLVEAVALLRGWVRL